jgi:hypothetical protein
MPRTSRPSKVAESVQSQNEENDLASDLMIGAKQIAAFLGRPPREIYYLGSVGRLPLFPWGTKLAGRKSTLRKHIQDLEKSGRED